MSKRRPFTISTDFPFLFASLSFYFRPKQGTPKWTRKGWQLLIVQAENGFFKRATNTLTPAWQSRNCYSTADYVKVAIRCKVSIKNAERIACENRVGRVIVFGTRSFCGTVLKHGSGNMRRRYGYSMSLTKYGTSCT